MNRLRLLTLLPAIVTLAAGCAGSASTGDEILFGTADTAVFIGDFATTVFYEVPRFLFWTTPKAVLYDLPRAGILALSGPTANVESLIDRLDDPDLPTQEDLAIIAELRRLTGIPLGSRAAWLSWWRENHDVPESRWLPRFSAKQVEDLLSPDYFRRAAAISRLTEIYGTDLGYDPKDDPERLRAGATRWSRKVAGH